MTDLGWNLLAVADAVIRSKSFMTPRRVLESLIVILLGLSIAPCFAAAPPGYSLSWSDEFNQPTINTNEWNFREGGSYHSFQQGDNVTVQKDGLHIAEKEENHGIYPYTGGGLITKRAWKYGYFETRAKMGGRGFHEAFWSTFSNGNEKFDAPLSNAIEIDAFEHELGGWKSVGESGFSSGVIHWSTRKNPANLLRVFPDVKGDPGNDFHTFAYESQPGFIRFYIDGRSVGICDMRDFPDISSNNVWLSAVATRLSAEPGEAVFKYLRIYSADAETQKQRCHQAYAELDAARGKMQSNGIDLWLDAADFTDLGGWTPDVKDGERGLLGHKGKNTVQSESDRYASVRFQVPRSANYQLWVRSYEADSQPGSRFFSVELNGAKSPTLFGKQNNPGWSWQRGGTFSLPAGPSTLSIYDSSAYFARVGRILLTSDLNFAPDGIGGRENVSPLR